MKSVIAFDIGDKRIGVAGTDPFGEYAVPSDTYFRTGSAKEDVAALLKIARAHGAETIVCGLPLHSDGTESVQTEKTRRFIALLKKETEIPVVETDERYTTLEARRDLLQTGVSAKKDKKKKNVDSLAAAYILERYLQENLSGGNTMNMKEETNDYEDEDNIVELLDEDGNTLRYEHMGTIEYEGEWYCILAPEKTEEESEEDEVAVFHIVGDENDETLETIEDNELLDAVFAEFCNQYGYTDEDDESEPLEIEGD